jgi:alkylation response protein AidB-like acyl-CoA dehydrogenase
VSVPGQALRQPLPDLEAALRQIAAGAAERDGHPHPEFPEAPFALLEGLGVLAANATPGRPRPPAAAELALVRAVARADGSVGRIFDGHVNAVERLAVQAPAELMNRDLDAVRAGRLRAGVWGGDPAPGEGPPAAIIIGHGGEALRGVKTFCSGAGGLHRAMVLARTEAGGPPVSVWIDLTDRRVEIDESWYRSHGLRASVSHRVVFHDAPVLARLGGPGAIAEQPWFGRDALRTAASWAGMADTAADSALAELAARPQRSPLEGLAAGRILTARRAIDLWIGAAGRAMDAAEADTAAAPAREPELAHVAIQARVAIADACRSLLDEAARACGSRPFARGGPLDRARRDLEVFLLQHRLEPLLARDGESALSESSP